jgi:hypothetical protein
MIIKVISQSLFYSQVLLSLVKIQSTCIAYKVLPYLPTATPPQLPPTLMLLLRSSVPLCLALPWVGMLKHRDLHPPAFILYLEVFIQVSSGLLLPPSSFCSSITFFVSTIFKNATSLDFQLSYSALSLLHIPYQLTTCAQLSHTSCCFPIIYFSSFEYGLCVFVC